MIHALHLLNHFTLGGIEVMLLNALPYLRERGIELSFGCLGKENLLDNEVREAGGTILRLPKSANPHRSSCSLEAVLRRSSFDLVHSHFGYTSGGWAKGAARHSTPFVNSLHASSPTALESWDHSLPLSLVKRAWLRYHRFLLDHSPGITLGHSISNLDAFDPGWRNDKRKQLLYNGVQFPERVDPVSLPSPLILHIGSFRPAKNHPYLLKIFKQILKEEPTATLLLLGEGSERSAIEKLANELKIAGQIRFGGAVKDPFPYYAAADLFLFPSSSEGFGNVLVEAQGMGVPIAASNLPALREATAPSQHHALFPLDNAQSAATIALNQLHHPVGVSEAKDLVRKRFTVERFAAQLADYYHQLLGKAPSSDASFREAVAADRESK